MHKGLIILAIVILGVVKTGQTQEKLSTLEVDSQSYELYRQKEWKTLTRFGKNARKQGIDFYYLRYRMGISYYELSKYRQAIPCFERVVEQSPNDSVALEYLYYSYLFAGRFEDARMLSLKFDPPFKKRLDIPDRKLLFHAAGMEYKYYQLDDFTVPNETTGKSLEQKVRVSLNYANVNFTHYSKSRFSLFHAFSYIWGMNRLYDPNQEAYNFDENLRQYQYYLAGNWHIGKGLDMTLAFHYLRTTLEGLNPTMGSGPGPGNQNQKYLYISKENGYVGFIKFSKSVSNFNFRISGTISDLNGGIQYQPLAGFDYYPLGNTNLYFSSDVAYLIAPSEEHYTPGLVIKQKMGVRVFRPVWVEPYLQYGSVSNYADEDAYVIYNSHDVIDYWYGARLNIYLADYTLNLYYIFQYYQNTNYLSVAGIPDQVGYNSSTHLLGLRWRLR